MTAAPPVISPSTWSAAPAMRSPRLGDVVRRVSLLWLLLGNTVGLWLAVLLVWPDAGSLLGALTYGRWAPLHLNWQLYGWCALPLVGALLQFCDDPGQPRAPRLAVGALVLWSLALVGGGVSWLGGHSSGKLFLDWHGWARPALPVAMGALWLVLIWMTWRTWRERSLAARGIRLVLLATLAVVPFLLFWASSRDVYPSVNPHSGGATGASLLASTLGVVGIFALLPTLLGVPPRPGSPRPTRYWLAWLASWTVYAALDHGHASHHAWPQLTGLAVLLLWIPLLPSWLKGYSWANGGRPWLRAALIWWAVLVFSGWGLFLPGLSERLKFTNALVAHAHLAMAGLITSVNFVILNELDRTRPLQRGFVWWQAGCAVHVVVLTLLGWFEREHAASFFPGTAWVNGAYLVRLAAGLAMAVGSLLAWRESDAS